MTGRRYLFGTPDWFALMQATIDDRLAAFRARASADRIAELSFSMAEIALDPPLEIGRGAGRVGWRCRIEAGQLAEFDVAHLDGADYTVYAPYEVLRSLARFDTTGREAEYARLTGAALERGELRVAGRPPRAPREFGDIHNLMARATL